MLLYKVNMTIVLDDQAVKGSGYMSHKPESVADVLHLIPDWVRKWCRENGVILRESVTIYSFSFEVTKDNVLSLLNAYADFTVHDIYEEC